jgi:hypothetical protein
LGKEILKSEDIVQFPIRLLADTPEVFTGPTGTVEAIGVVGAARGFGLLLGILLVVVVERALGVAIVKMGFLGSYALLYTIPIIKLTFLS